MLCRWAAVVFSGITLHAAVTFHKDVEPILQNHCQSCHRPGEIAPMSLLTYEQARPWAKAIRTAVLTGKMPPWSADPHYGKFRNDPSLTQQEKDTLVAWVDGGSKEGSPAGAPPARVFPRDGWQITPDLVFEMPTEFEVPPKGTIDYQSFSVATHFTEDKWIQMAEVLPGNRAVVHHGMVTAETPGSSNEDFLAGYAPGMTPQNWPDGQARL